MDLDDPHSQATQNFLSWFTSLPGATFHPSLTLTDLRRLSLGRGIIANTTIPAETPLFTIPRSSILCAATSPLSTHLPDLFDLDNPSNTQDSWTLLILILIHAHLQGPTSPWHPYLSILPTDFNTPMFWGEADLAHLQASTILPKIGKESADTMLREKVLSVVSANPAIFYPPGTQPLSENELLSLAHRMGSAIMAYAFDLDKEDDEDEEGDGWVEDKEGRIMLGMVPMADMLNADAEFNAHINHGEDELTAVSTREIRAGEEVLNYYGPLGNGELLRRYGYVTRSHARHDVVEVGWGLVERRLKGWFGERVGEKEWGKVGAIMAEGDDEGGEWEDSFVVEREVQEPDEAGRLGEPTFVKGLPDELEERVKAFLKAVKKVASGVADLLGDRNMRKVIYLESVLGALKDREAEFATSLEEDQALIAQCERPVTREQMAVWVRAGEKQILREAQLWVEEELPAMREQACRPREDGDEGAPSAKRQRR
ncbi:hypothetical protein OQA88_5568 [Cercophora sp. LCS_1]